MDLARTQFLSLFSKAITTAFGIIQSIVIIRILSPAEYGLVGLVMSIGGVIGSAQHLGIVDGAIREIAVLKNRNQIGKVFWVSHAIRQAITIPLSLGLLILAGIIATNIYHRPEIIPFIQLFAGILILQGFQDVLNATLTGLKKFVALYTVQVITAAINVLVFSYFTWRFGIGGFFWAIIITTTIMVLLFSVIIARALSSHLSLPTVADFKHHVRRIMRIGMFMYAARMLFFVWQKLPLLVLGGVLAAEDLGFINVSLTFGSKLTIIAMSLSELNLSWMSSLYSNKKDKFKAIVTRNMHRVLVLMTLMALILLFFSPEIIIYIIGTGYLPAHQMILIITLAFFLYALIDIGTSSVFVSANKPQARAFIYSLMTGLSGMIIAFLFFLRPDPLLATYAVLAGSVLAYLTMVILSRTMLNISLLTRQLAFFLVALFASVAWLSAEPNLPWRITVFLLLVTYILIEARRSNLVPTNFLDRFQGSRTTKPLSWIVCFAGATYNQPIWTNRQHIMLRFSSQMPVLYIEPRIWLPRFLLKNILHPLNILSFVKRVLWYDHPQPNLYVKAQYNLIPGSRQVPIISTFNHILNQIPVMATASLLGFKSDSRTMWIYDTEAAQYLGAFKSDTVVYDCVDDHTAQAGVSKHTKTVTREEDKIMARANLVTVTSKFLYDKKKKNNANTHLVLNAGDVKLFSRPLPRHTKLSAFQNMKGPIFGTVGALDSYKLDFSLLEKSAQAHPAWQFVLIGAPVVDQQSNELKKIGQLVNVHLFGSIPRHQIPVYVHHFDVCLIPYTANNYNKASFPLKFWEFMATGKPIVVTGLPELKAYQPYIHYAKNLDAFNEACSAALTNPNKDQVYRRQLSRQHDWSNRTQKLIKLLQQTLSHSN